MTALKPLRLIVACVTLLSGASWAGDTCPVLQKDGRWVNGPCKQVETPIPCGDETRNAYGGTTWQARPCRPGEQKTLQQVAREEEAAQRKLCGKDFGKIRVGMSLDRFEQCTDGLAYITETVTKSGVVETYRSTFFLVHAADGKIVGFTKRTH